MKDVNTFTAPIDLDFVFQYTKSMHSEKDVVDQFEHALTLPKITGSLAMGLLYGEIHPDFETLIDVLSINMNFAAIRILNFHRKSDTEYEVTFEPITTKCGLAIIQAMTLDPTILRFIPRVLLNENREIVQCITIDVGVQNNLDAHMKYSCIETGLLEEKRTWEQS